MDIFANLNNGYLLKVEGGGAGGGDVKALGEIILHVTISPRRRYDFN